MARRYQFVDCRWSLEDPAFGANAYREGHIPGAVFVDVERELAGPPGEAGSHPLPSGDVFASGSLGGAERLWWLLRHAGHVQVAVIDLEAWRGPLARGVDQAPRARFE